ncbi:hypothetical protein DVV14_11040 [Vibrio coralliilyticus]|nr:hypothetical protein DVV14_11040 [Vibrio coralliilyticus]
MNNNASQRDGDCCYSSAFQIVKELCFFTRKLHFLKTFSGKNPTTYALLKWFGNLNPKILREWWAIPGSNQ